MSANDYYVKPPRKSVFKNTAGTGKSPYSYLHPDYRKRKLIHLVLVVPVVLIIYTLICALLHAVILPWEPTIIDTIIIFILTIISAYFYPFALWQYKQSITGTTLNDMLYVGSITGVLSRKIGTLIFGIVLAGVLAPITGPLALRKCRKKNLIIGEEVDFEKKG